MIGSSVIISSVIRSSVLRSSVIRSSVIKSHVPMSKVGSDAKVLLLDETYANLRRLIGFLNNYN